MPTTAPIKVPILSQDKWTKDFNRLHKSFAAMGATVTKAGSTLTRSVTLPIAVAGVASLKMAKDFNAAMANVGTLIPGQTKRLQELKTELLDLSKVTAINERELAEGGLYQTISAFGDSAETMGRLAIVAKAAKAGMSTTAESLSLLSSVTQGFGDTSEKAVQKAADLAFLTVKLGKTTYPELASSMGRDVAMADALKVSQDELFASFATLTTISDTAEVATQLASLFGALIKPTEGMSKAAKKLGFESSVAMIRELGFTKTIQSLAQVTGGSTEKLGKLITRKEGLQAVLALTGTQADTYIKKLEAMRQSSGALDDAFKAQTEGINKTGFAFDQSVQQIRVMFIEIGDKLMPILAKLLPHVSNLIDKFNSLSDEQLETRLKILGLIATIGPLVLIFGKTMGAISGTITFFGKLRDIHRAYLVITNQAIIAEKAQAVALKETGLQAEITGTKLSTAGKLAKGATWSLGVLAAGAVGWEIGTLIHDNIIEPAAKARHEIELLRKDLEDTVKKRDLSKRSEKQLDKDIVNAKKVVASDRAAVAELDFAAQARGGGLGFGYKSSFVSVQEDRLKQLEQAKRNVHLKNIDKELEDKYKGSSYLPDILDELWGEDKKQSVDSNVTVVIEGLPGVRAKVKNGKNVKSVAIEHKGGVMEGAL
jgi:TP901 family phage tail tape measure protein